MQRVAFPLSTLLLCASRLEISEASTSFKNRFRCCLSYCSKADVVRSINADHVATFLAACLSHKGVQPFLQISHSEVFCKHVYSLFSSDAECNSLSLWPSHNLLTAVLRDAATFKRCRHLLLSCGRFQTVLKCRALVFFLLAYSLHLKEILLFFFASYIRHGGRESLFFYIYTSTIYRISRGPRGTLYRCLGFPLELPSWSQFAAFCLNCI